jgi:putative ABC transport system permease protein
MVFRNVRRSPLRASMTVLTVAVMLAAFIFPRTLVEAQAEQVRQTPNNRVVARSKEGWSGWMPYGYADRIREQPGVRYACASRWAGLRLPGKDNLFFPSFATEAEPLLAMHTELSIPAEQKQAFLANERGAMVSEQLATELGWKLGDRLVFDSRNAPGQWEVEIVTIFRSQREGFAERMVWIHYGFYNRGLPAEQQDRVGMISAEIFEPNQGGRIARELDARFDAAPHQTLTLEDRVMAQANIGTFSAILTALDVVSYLILAVVMSIVGNTLAMNVRERTHEYGVMRAIGFGGRQIGLLVLGEAALLGLLGAAIGVGLSYPLFEKVVSRVLRDAFQFPPIVIPSRVAWLSFALGIGLSALAAAVPVYRVSQLRVTEALRRIG